MSDTYLNPAGVAELWKKAKEQSQPGDDVWSLTETRIGTWIDGKPLYRMVFNITLPDADTPDMELATTADDKNVVNLYGMFLYNNRQSQPLNAASAVDSFTYLFYRRGSIRIVLKGSNFYGKPAWVTIEYTKTADSPSVIGYSIFNAPIGAILAWSGTENDVPEGWSICDGENGTLDLRDKFILGAGESHNVGETGGLEKVKLDANDLPPHIHYTSLKSGAYKSSESRSGLVRFTEEGGLVVETSTNTTLNNAHENMPPYYTLLWIQKTSITPTDYATIDDVETTIQNQIEEYDTDDGWHIRKHSDGYVEMFAKISKSVSSSDFLDWGGGYVLTADNFKNFPFPLEQKYGESATMLYPVAGALTQSDGGKLTRTTKYGFWRATAVPLTLEIAVSVFGRVSDSTQLSLESLSVSSPSSSEILSDQETGGDAN